MDGEQPQSTFETIDPKLTVFALANGMDLSKADDHRRLEWFSEGLERAILIRSVADGGFAVDVMAWRNGAPDRRTEDVAAEVTDVAEISAVLNAAIDTANALEAPG